MTRNKGETIEKLRKLNDKDIKKVIEVFDFCLECWNTKNPEKCEYQELRKKIGLEPCRMMILKAEKIEERKE